MTWPEIIKLILFCFAALAAIYRFSFLQLKQFKPGVSAILFQLKFAAGIALWMIYTFYYTDTSKNDAYKFYNNAKTLHELSQTHPSEFIQLMFTSSAPSSSSLLTHWERNFDEAPINENRTAIRLQTLIMFVSGGVYPIHILLMCLLSWIGIVLFVNATASFTYNKDNWYWLSIITLPSFMFWSSGVMKEPLIVLGLGLFISGLFNKKYVLLAFGVLILAASKFYLLLCLMPATVAYFLARKTHLLLKITTGYLSVSLLLFFIAIAVGSFSERFNAVRMISEKQTNAIREASYFGAGSAFSLSPINNHISGLIKAIPIGVWNVFTRPYPWQCNSAFMYFNLLENIWVFALLIYGLKSLGNNKPISANSALFLITASLTYFALVGITTPVAGNLVRYKSLMLPVFFSGILLLGSEKRN